MAKKKMAKKVPGPKAAAAPRKSPWKKDRAGKSYRDARGPGAKKGTRVNKNGTISFVDKGGVRRTVSKEFG